MPALEKRPIDASPARIDGLIAWVMDAPVEDVCWRITEIGTMRDWLLTQKAATDLRIRAVRLELIALRKVARGGLSTKIAGHSQLRGAADWLATLTDEEFANALEEIDGARTPISLYREDLAERRALQDSLAAEDNPIEDEERLTRSQARVRNGWDQARTRSATTVLLANLITEGEPFTVAEAATSLADQLGIDTRLHPESSEGLREVVRSAIRRGDGTVRVDAWSELPVAFTVNLDGGDSYIRVPATTARVAHLHAHVAEVQARARATEEHAKKLRELLVAILYIADPMNADPVNVDDNPSEETLNRPLAPLVDQINPRWRSEANKKKEVVQ